MVYLELILFHFKLQPHSFFFPLPFMLWLLYVVRLHTLKTPSDNVKIFLSTVVQNLKTLRDKNRLLSLNQILAISLAVSSFLKFSYHFWYFTSVSGISFSISFRTGLLSNSPFEKLYFVFSWSNFHLIENSGLIVLLLPL